MTDQSQPLTYNIAEIGQKFGAQLSLAYADIILLEKQLEAKTLTIQSMTASKTARLDRIAELEVQLHQAQCDILAAQGKAIINEPE